FLLDERIGRAPDALLAIAFLATVPAPARRVPPRLAGTASPLAHGPARAGPMARRSRRFHAPLATRPMPPRRTIERPRSPIAPLLAWRVSARYIYQANDYYCHLL